MEIANYFGRYWRTVIKRFGVYEKVVPVSTTPIKEVPGHIVKPDYVIFNEKVVFNVPKESEIKDVNQIRGMRRSSKLAANILTKVEDFIKAGITTDDIDEKVHTLTVEAGAYPSPLNYKGFPKSVCTSVNNVAVHGIPDLRPLQDGDIINVDITVYFKGFHGDCSKTFLVGNVDQQGTDLVSFTEESLMLAIKACGPEVPFTAIGSTIYRHARVNGFTVMPAFCGHGIGQYFHGPPEIYHMLNRYPGVMKPGMTFTIEPVLTHGNGNSILLEDGWTVVTEDTSRAAQFEHTIHITDDGAEILTK